MVPIATATKALPSNGGTDVVAKVKNSVVLHLATTLVIVSRPEY